MGVRPDDLEALPARYSRPTDPIAGESVAEEINRLLRGLREQLAVPPTIAIATAYLNAQGFDLLADELERAPRVCV